MKHKTRTKALSWLLSLALALSLVPGMSLTAYAASVSYVDSSGNSQTADATELAEGTTTWANGSWYIAPEGGITISSRITVNGTVNLILRDGATLTANAGITTTSATLNIYAQSAGTGALIAKGSDGCAGIGGVVGSHSDGGAGGTVSIFGGTVTATGGNAGQYGGGAGIGGGGGDAGSGGAGGTVSIFGGTVTATGGAGQYGGGAGIGGGSSDRDNGGAGGTVSISGGTVTATGGAGGRNCGAGAGIGGGGKGSRGSDGTGGTLTLDAGVKLETSANNSDWTDTTSNTNTRSRYMRTSYTPPHTHSFTYEAGTGENANTITATCGAEGCTLPNNTATLTITPSSSGGSTAELTGDKSEFDLTSVEITYKKKDSTGWNPIDAATVAAATSEDTGFYEASATIVEGKTISVTYGINAIHKGTATGGGNCDFSIPRTANVGVKIEPDLTLATGYEVKKITVKDGDTDVSEAVRADKTGFIMPDYNVTVYVEFGKIPYKIEFNPMSYGTVTASKDGSLVSESNPANFGDTITLIAAPDDGFALKNKLQYKQQSNGMMNEPDNASNTWTFTMPASNITVYATFEGAPYDVTISDEITGGTVTASGSGVETVSNVTTAKAGTEVWLTVTPATGFVLDSVTVTKTADSSAVSVTKESNTIYKFTMPQAAVTVTATFVGKPVTVTLNTTGDGGTASLLRDDYTAVTNEKPLTKKAGEKFILLVNRDDGYEFNVQYGTGSAVSMTEFTKAQYEDYVTYAKTNNINVPTNTVLVWVTTPGVSENSVALTVNFSKLQTFTILYQPTGNPDNVWCKFAVNSGVDGNNTDSAQMKSDATMGDGSKVYSLKVTAGFSPNQVDFATSSDGFGSDTMKTITAKEAAPTQESDWTPVTGGKAVIIGGDAKTVIVAFVANADAMKAYKDNAVDAAKTTGGVEYRVAVVAGGSAGTVKAPANTLTKEGYDFAGWRGVEGTAPNKTEKIYNAGDSISVSENTTLNAFWKRKKSTVTLNLNGGTGNSSVDPVTYGETLTISENPTRSGFAFDGWTVSKAVTENGVAFAKGSPFDLDTPITANLSLTAQWKHVHSYTCYKISELGLTDYESYEDYIHVAICGCGDIKLEAHEFDSSGKCACGYQKPGAQDVTLNISYGQWSSGTYTEKMQGMPETAKQGQEVSIYAPNTWGSLQFSKWQYSTDNSTWYDLTADAYASFLIPATMTVRALYVNPVTKPHVDLSARSYEDQTVVNGQTYTMDNILFQMNYKLPDGYTFVDAGIRLGDNAGISYYELKEKTYTTTAGGKAMLIGAAAVTSILSGGITTVDLSATDTYYEEHTRSVLTEMSAATLAKYMYESKPINVEKYDPIYWEAKAVTKGMSGSMATLPPLRFAQKDNQNHWIYGIGWLRYKDSSGNIKTIYTDALAATVKNIPGSVVTKSGS